MSKPRLTFKKKNEESPNTRLNISNNLQNFGLKPCEKFHKIKVINLN